MTIDEAIKLLRRGRCLKRHESPCSTCDATDEAMLALVREGARVALAAYSDAVAESAAADAIAREVLS